MQNQVKGNIPFGNSRPSRFDVKNKDKKMSNRILLLIIAFLLIIIVALSTTLAWIMLKD